MVLLNSLGIFSKIFQRYSTTSPSFFFSGFHLVIETTLQGINISHLGKRKIIFKMPFWGDMLVPWRVSYFTDASETEAFWQGWIPAIQKSICLNYPPTSTITGVGIPKNQWKEYIVKGIRMDPISPMTYRWLMRMIPQTILPNRMSNNMLYIYFWKPVLFCFSCYWQLGV